MLPVQTRHIIAEDVYEDDLEALVSQQELGEYSPMTSPLQSTGTIPVVDSISRNPRSWSAPWPKERGIRDSTIFRYIQHCGKLKKEGNFQQETITAINSIPHLDVTLEDRENEYLAIFTNDATYRVRSEDPDKISAMKKDNYTLKAIESNSIVDLVIEAEVLNEPFIEATKQHNYLVEKINEFTGSRKERRSFLSIRSTPTIFTRLEEPLEATRVWAELVPQSGQRQLCAVAFKLGDKIVFREDILRKMNDVQSRLEANISRIIKEIPAYRAKISNEEMKRMQESYIGSLNKCLDHQTAAE